MRTIRVGAAVSLIARALVLLPGCVTGQEVAGDVMMPPPREMVSGMPKASGLGPGDATLGVWTMAAYRTALESVVAQVRAGTLGESDARIELGDVLVSLLAKSGVVVFEG